MRSLFALTLLSGLGVAHAEKILVSYIAGAITLALSVDARGTVTDVSAVEDALGAPELTRCLASTMRPLRFPGAAGESTIRVRLALRSDPR